MITALFFAIEAMAENEGWPRFGVVEVAEDLYLFYPEGHLVTFRRNEGERLVTVMVIRPVG